MLLERSNERQLAADYTGDILLWDIDKTYLDTRFSSWRGLLAIPFEFAIDKRTIAGAVPLLRALRRGCGSESKIVPLYFVSGSPPQLRRVIERRMTLDGVDFDGITFKDQWRLLLGGRLADIRAQVGYKLAALLMYRAELPLAARWLCFGDDVESDATTFLLFGDVCAGLRGNALRQELQRLQVAPNNIGLLCDLADGLPVTPDPLERVFIHLEQGTPPEHFGDSRLTPTHSYLQTALKLCHMQRIAPEAVATVARDLRLRGMPESVLARDLQDAQERLAVPLEFLSLAALH